MRRKYSYKNIYNYRIAITCIKNTLYILLCDS